MRSCWRPWSRPASGAEPWPWEGVTLVGDSASDITNLKDISFTSKDLFTAILLDMLEQRSFEGLDTSAAKTVTKVTGTINDLLKIGYGTVDMKLSAMPKPLVNQVAKTIPIAFFAEDPFLQGLDGVNKVFSKVSIGLKAYDTLEDYVEYLNNSIYLYTLSESMKDVLREMYDQALCGDYPLELQLALMDCMEIINAADGLVLCGGDRPGRRGHSGRRLSGDFPEPVLEGRPHGGGDELSRRLCPPGCLLPAANCCPTP